MKKTGFLFVLCMLCTFAGAQEIVSDFQQKYEKDTEFTLINVSAKMFEMIATTMDVEKDHIIRNLTGFRMISTKDKTQELFKDALKSVESSKHEELVVIQKKDENMRIYTREEKGVITSLVILICNNEFTMIGLTGKIDLKQLVSLSKTLNINQLDNIPLF